ncbi:MAG: DUF6483 family protein [Oscillospiraceae bacterium]|nr:hypothetical protein [Oscillospiraceae bacterium]MCR4760720.1 DUF6483 family protein [Oscillospiraceae bacterium]
MFEQDYLLRQIKETIAVIMKAVFGLEINSVDELIAYQEKAGGEPDLLFRLVDSGEISQAEMKLYESMETKTAANLLKGYAFYQYVAQKDDDFLEANGYSRDMIADGVRRLAALFGAGHLAELFMPDEIGL